MLQRFSNGIYPLQEVAGRLLEVKEFILVIIPLTFLAFIVSLYHPPLLYFSLLIISVNKISYNKFKSIVISFQVKPV